VIVAVTFRVVGWVEHVATVNAGKVLYPLPPAVRDTAVTTPEAIVAVPLAPEPPVPLKVKLCVPLVQPALPLLLIAPPLGASVEPLAVVLKARLPADVFVMVTVPEDELAVAPGFAAQAVPPQVPLIAFLRLVALVLLLPLRTTQKLTPEQLDSHMYVSVPTVIVVPVPGSLVMVTVPVVVAAATATVAIPTVAVAEAAVVGVPPEKPTVGNAV
jgi:hypothetical protein